MNNKTLSFFVFVLLTVSPFAAAHQGEISAEDWDGDERGQQIGAIRVKCPL